MRRPLVLAYIIIACLPLSSSLFTSIPAPSYRYPYSLVSSRTKQLRLEALNHQYSPTRTSTPFRFVRNFIVRQNSNSHQQPAKKKEIINRLIEYIKMSVLLKSYNSILANHPIKTEIFTSASLWFLGDILAQKLEHREMEKSILHPIQVPSDAPNKSNRIFHV